MIEIKLMSAFPLASENLKLERNMDFSAGIMLLLYKEQVNKETI